MPLIQGGQEMPGARNIYSALMDIKQAQQGGAYSSPGLPAAGYLNGVAHPNAYVRRADTGAIYQNTGTLAATVWTLVSP